MLFFFIVESYLRKDSRFHSLKNEGKRKKQALKGTKNFLATVFCLCLFFFSFVFPFSQMLYWSIKFPEYLANFEILKLNLNTFLLIFFTSFFLISVAIFTNFGNRVFKKSFFKFFQQSFNFWLCYSWYHYFSIYYKFFFVSKLIHKF